MRTIIVLTMVVFLSACSDGGGVNTGTCLISDTDTSNTSYGEFTSIQKQYSLTKDYVASKMSETSSELAAAITSGVHVYKISYNSKITSADTETIKASGLLIVPYTACTDADNTAPWMVLNHGTIVDNASAPSNNLREGLFEGGLGFITVVPDYIGFGDSYVNDPSVRIHPYIIADTYATDGYAIMNAATQVLTTNGITPGNLYLKGYSEGGYAALALQRSLETLKASGQTDFTITASAPSAGPYSTVGLGAALTTSLADTTISPTLMAYLATSYYYNYPTTVGAAYDIVDVFKKSNEYDVETIFDGTKSSTETEAIYASLGISTINTLLEPDVVSAMATDTLAIATGAAAISGDAGASFGAAIAGMTDAFSSALFTNDILYTALAGVASFAPNVPTIFYHCSDDETIYPSATAGAVATFTGLGSTSIFSNTSQTGGHSGCGFTLTPSLCFKEIEEKLAENETNTVAGYLASPDAGSYCNN